MAIWKPFRLVGPLLLGIAVASDQAIAQGGPEIPSGGPSLDLGRGVGEQLIDRVPDVDALSSDEIERLGQDQAQRIGRSRAAIQTNARQGP